MPPLFFFNPLPPPNVLGIIATFSHTQAAPQAPNPPSQLQILLHNRDPLCVDGKQIRILKQMYQVRFRCLLQRQDRRALPPQLNCSASSYNAHFRSVVLRDLPYKPREGQLAQQQVCRFLVPPDFLQRGIPGAVPPLAADWKRVTGCSPSD